ncbi:hypothetical protein [Caldisalinibacter kiritimatiensis]|uniref:Uncharacterized protein n=1 Tax=Caldisalinibacter kiritimatiensis TaxID=1304284 RepID=R1ASV6_9FIRM|nr:hypothetical protein [Caldisalinibacter kiritimatiensis]EOD00233.1 hypothetical protein L21TH_1707 [Caldisalinibacter kiritimatiensis]
MIKYLTHYYRDGTTPFKSLSALPEKEAIKKMKKLYVDDAMWGRFKDPVWYLRQRKKTELWLREQFILKGGLPKENYPIYAVLGKCEKIEQNMEEQKLAKIQIPLSAFKKEDISFTYIDSMFSYQLGRDKSPKYYQPEYHGKVFTISEICSIFKERGLPKKGWWGDLPDDFFPYIEVQIWNHQILRRYL